MSSIFISLFSCLVFQFVKDISEHYFYSLRYDTFGLHRSYTYVSVDFLCSLCNMSFFELCFLGYISSCPSFQPFHQWGSDLFPSTTLRGNARRITYYSSSATLV